MSTEQPSTSEALAAIAESRNSTTSLRGFGRTTALFAFALGCLASNAAATSCWCKIDPTTFKTAGGAFYSWGRNTIAMVQEQTSTCIENSSGVGITLAATGFNAPECSSERKVCEFPAYGEPNVPDGTKTFTVTCQALDWYDWETATPHYKYDTDSISVVIDNTPPVISIVEAPVDGSTLPYTSFRISGTIDDGSPIVSFQTESGVHISTNGSQWFVDIATTNAVGNPPTIVVMPLSGRMDFSVKAIDIVGNLIAVSTESQFITNPLWVADPAMAHYWYFDGVPPVVVVSTPLGTVKTFSEISGTASDASVISEIKIAIRNDGTGEFWSSLGFGTATVFVPVSVNADGHWTLEVQSKELPVGQTYSIFARAIDALGNKTNPDIPIGVFTIQPGTSLTTVGNAVDMSNIFSFSPSNAPVPYGRSLDICAQVKPNVDPTLKGIALSQVVFEVTPGGALRPLRPIAGEAQPAQPLSARLSGTCLQDGIPLRIFSDKERCIDVGRLTAKVLDASAGYVDITVLLPTETNSVFGPNDHLNAIFFPNPTCPHGATWCAIDIYDVHFDLGAVTMDLIDQSFREVVEPAHHLNNLPFCDAKQQPKVVQGKPRIFSTNSAVWPDRVGIIRDPDPNRPLENTLVDQAGIYLAFQTQRPYKCGAEAFQQWYVNKCRIPRDPKRFIRQRTQVILTPNSTGINPPTFSTSKSDERTPHGNLNSQ